MTPRQAVGHGAQHLIGDVQRFGLLSAAAVVDRYAELIDRATRDESFRSPPLPADERGTGWMVDSAARIADTYLSLVDTIAELIPNRAMADTAVPNDGKDQPASDPVGIRLRDFTMGSQFDVVLSGRHRPPHDEPDLLQRRQHPRRSSVVLPGATGRRRPGDRPGGSTASRGASRPTRRALPRARADLGCSLRADRAASRRRRSSHSWP